MEPRLVFADLRAAILGGDKLQMRNKLVPLLSLTRRLLKSEFITAPLVMSCLFLFGFGKFMGGDRSIATFQDNTHFLLPLFHHISRSFSLGEYPYWINTIVAGTSLYNSPQFSLTYPFYFFQSGLYATPLDALRQTHYVTFLHLFIAYLNSYILLRVLRLAFLPALLGASLFVFSPNMYSYSTWINIIAPYAWFPLVVAAVFLILENNHAKVGILLGAISLALLILASPAQPLIHIVYMIGILYVFNAASRLRNKERAALRTATRNLCVMGALAFLLASPVLVPVLVNSKQMIRFIGDAPGVVGYSKIPFAAFTIGQLEIRHLAGSLLALEVPSVIGDSFVGMSAVLLALLAIFKRRANWIIRPVLLISLYALLSSTGNHLGLAKLNYYLPLINKIREPGRHLFLYAWGVSMLAAFGFAYLIEALNENYRAVFKLKHAAVAAVFLVLLIASFSVDLPDKGSLSKWVLLILFGLTFGLLLMLPRFNGRARKIIPVLAVLLIVYSNLQYPWYLPKLQDGDYFAAENLASHKTLEELAKIQDVRNYRIIFADKTFSSQYWSMNASYYGLRSFQAFMNPLPSAKQFEEVFQQFSVRHYYPLLGARYYLCSSCDAMLLRDYDFQREINGYKLYVAAQALPRYALVNHVAGAYTNADDFYAKSDAGYDYTKAVYLTTADTPSTREWLGDQTALPEYVIKEEADSLNKLRLSINVKERAIFLLNEYYTKDWKVRVNGVQTGALKVNLNQVGVLLDKGANLVEFEYRPILFIWLLWIQRVTLVCLVLYILYSALSSWFRRFDGQSTPATLAATEF